MTGQCVVCQTPLPERARSPYCGPHFLEHKKERNREKSRRHRERESIYHPPPKSEEHHLPTETDLGWLDWMDAELGATIRQVVDLLKQGRPGLDPEVAELALWGLHRFDSVRGVIEEKARPVEGGRAQFSNWNGYFESVRRVLT
jgi:hypothetical protein